MITHNPIKTCYSKLLFFFSKHPQHHFLFLPDSIEEGNQQKIQLIIPDQVEDTYLLAGIVKKPANSGGFYTAIPLMNS